MISAYLKITSSIIKAFRTAFYAYQLNFLNAIPTFLGQVLPMSLVPCELLLQSVEAVIIDQCQEDDRLTFAVLAKEILASYETAS